MKHLNVKWVPETFAIFSLSVAPSLLTSPDRDSGSAEPNSVPVSAAVPCTRIIVISEGGKLKADVITEQVNSLGAVPELAQMS